MPEPQSASALSGIVIPAESPPVSAPTEPPDPPSSPTLLTLLRSSFAVSPLHLVVTPLLLATPPRLSPALLKSPPALLASPPFKLGLAPLTPLFAVQIRRRCLGLLLRCRRLLPGNRSTSSPYSVFPRLVSLELLGPSSVESNSWTVLVQEFIDVMDFKVCDPAIPDLVYSKEMLVIYGVNYYARWRIITALCRILHSLPGVQLSRYRLCLSSMESVIQNGLYHLRYMLYTVALSLPVVVVRAFVSAAQQILPASSLARKLVSLSLLTVKPLVSSRGQKILHGFELLEMDSVHYTFQSWWCILVAGFMTPPEPPDPPDFIISLLCSFVIWIFGSTVLTLSNLGDMSIVTARSSTAPIPSSNQGSLLLGTWNAWRWDSSLLPLYEDRFTLPLYEDLSTLPLYEEFVTLPLYEDLDFFMEFFTLLCSLFLNGCVTRGVIKSSFDRCSYAFVAILEMGNCALAAVLISGVRSSIQDFTLLNNFTVDEIRRLLRDFNLFKCFVVIIPLCFLGYLIVISACYAFMAMFLANTYSFNGD